MEYLGENKFINTINWFIIVGLLLMVLTSFNESFNRVLLWTFVPFSTIICCFYHKSLFFNNYLKFLFFLFLWCTIDWLLVGSQFSEISAVIQIWGVYAFCVIIAHMATYPKFFNYLNYLYLILFVVCLKYGWDNLLDEGLVFDSTSRLGDKNLNANLYAYLFFFFTISIYYFGENSSIKQKKIFWHIIFLVLIPFSFYLAILTASRQVLILQIPLFILLLWKRYFSSRLNPGKFLFLVLLILIVFTFVEYFSDIYNHSLLKDRVEKEDQDSRILLIGEALNIISQHPILGVGLDNFKYYTQEGVFSHNSYLELFANSGILAFIIFTWMIFYFINNQYKLWKYTKSNIVFLFLIFGIFFIFANFFYVYYLNPWLIGYFIMIGSRSLVLNNEGSDESYDIDVDEEGYIYN